VRRKRAKTMLKKNLSLLKKMKKEFEEIFAVSKILRNRDLQQEYQHKIRQINLMEKGIKELI
jgi:hypothetical protein